MKHKQRSAFLLSHFLVTVFLVLQPGLTKSQVTTEKIVIGEKFKLHSEVLQEDRTVLVRFPKDYQKSSEGYPVLYVLDAEFFFQQAVATVQFLAELGYIRVQPIPQMIIVGIVNVDRNRDYTPTYAPEQLEVLRYPTSGKANEFIEFLSTELFPYIESHYRTQPYRILAGWSFGGLLTVHIFFEYPHLFSAYLAISPSLWWDKDLYVKKAETYIAQNNIPDKPLIVTLGALEAGSMGRSVRDGFIPLMEHKTDKLKFIEIPEESHEYVPYKALYEGLVNLFSDWIMPNEILEEGLQGIKQFYVQQSKKFGYEIEIPESAYFRLASRLFNNGEQEKAIEIAKLYSQKFPESSYAHFYLGLRLQQTGALELAKNCYQKSIQIEEASPEPDTERILMCKIKLHDIEKELDKK